MKVLLSIKPQFVDKIFSGEKRFEYRKRLFKRQNIKTIVIYATHPVSRIVGEFDIEGVLMASPAELWEGTKEFSGISELFFSEYFSGHKHGYAIQIGRLKKYRTAIDPYTKHPNFVPPQSFRYLS